MASSEYLAPIGVPEADVMHPVWGAKGDAFTDDGPAINAAIEWGGGGAPVRIGGGRTYAVSSLVAAPWTSVDARGATFRHIGSGHMLTVSAAEGFEWYGGRLVAGASTDAVLFHTGSLFCRIWPKELNGSAGAQHGLWIQGRNGAGVYYCDFRTWAHGCSTDGLFVDGWDPVYSSPTETFVNDVDLTVYSQQNTVGYTVDACEAITFHGGDCEGNTGVGIAMGKSPKWVRFLNTWLEGNNGGSSNEQFSVNTTYDPTCVGTNDFEGVGLTSLQSYWRSFRNQSGIWRSTPSGVTGSRLANPPVGQMFFDTTLGYPVWWNGSHWVNASGSSV